MKRLLIIANLVVFTSSIALAQTGNIKFTLTKNPGQANQVVIKAKNVSGSPIVGVLGASNLTLCITFPSSLQGITTSIASPISGQIFTPALRSKAGSDSVLAWNGLGTTSDVNFNTNAEVDIATITFTGGAPGATSTIKLACIAAAGSGFDYCYIAPGGTEHSGYSSPFYSNVVNDPLLVNCNGSNSTDNMCTSTLGLGDVSLPVKFLSFFAIKNGDDGKLNWTVENDQDNKLFEIERSLDGKNYGLLTKVNALANGRTVNTYEAIDRNLSSLGKPTSFYRVKQIDRNGEVTYSPIRMLYTDRKSTPANLYPNPAKGTTKLVIDVEQQTQGSILIRDMGGKVVKQIATTFVRGVNQQNLSVGELASGEYNVTVIVGNQTHNLKLTKIN